MAHTPPEQLGVPCTLLQAAGLAVVEQRPQLATLLLTSASQPLLAAPSQSWKLPVHEVTVQTPATHDPTALAGAHLAPQDLQLFVSVLRLTSHPLVGLPSQSAKPASQVLIPQTPRVHFGVAWASTHLLPQPLQLFGSLSSLASHPLATLLSQFPNGGRHVDSPHLPMVCVSGWQMAVPLG